MSQSPKAARRVRSASSDSATKSKDVQKSKESKSQANQSQSNQNQSNQNQSSAMDIPSLIEKASSNGFVFRQGYVDKNGRTVRPSCSQLPSKKTTEIPAGAKPILVGSYRQFKKEEKNSK